jgi:hypothetical protein
MTWGQAGADPEEPTHRAVAGLGKPCRGQPDGTSAYATATGEFAQDSLQSPVVEQYEVGADGALTPKNPPQLAATGARAIAVSPGGTSVYVTGSGQCRRVPVGRRWVASGAAAGREPGRFGAGGGEPPEPTSSSVGKRRKPGASPGTGAWGMMAA